MRPAARIVGAHESTPPRECATACIPQAALLFRHPAVEVFVGCARIVAGMIDDAVCGGPGARSPLFCLHFLQVLHCRHLCGAQYSKSYSLE